MTSRVAATIVLVVSLMGCAPSTAPVAGSPVPCDGELPDECFLPSPAPEGLGEWTGCGGPEWEAFEVGVAEAPWVVRGCRVVAAEPQPAAQMCVDGVLTCDDGAQVGCGLEETPSSDTCAAMLAACPGTGCDPANFPGGICPAVRCRYPLGWTR